MKASFLCLILITFSVKAQKSEAVYFKELKEIENTKFVVTYSKTFSKAKSSTTDKLVFIDTELNTSKEITLKANSNIATVSTKFNVKYQDAAFVLVETFDDFKSANMKINHPVRELYLIKLATFETIKLNSDNCTLTSWSVNENTATLVVLEKENEANQGNVSVQKIRVIQLKTGDSKEVFKIN